MSTSMPTLPYRRYDPGFVDCVACRERLENS
jgi:hypothetical protein